MTNTNTFAEQVNSAAQEIFGGTAGSWGLKLLLGAVAALVHAVETATLSIAAFAFLCLADAILGVMRQAKRNRTGDGQRQAIKVWRLVSGPAAKWFVGMIVLLCGSFFDLVLFGEQPFLGGPLLLFFSGVLLGAIVVEVAAKADYLQGWGLSAKLRKKYPQLFE